MSTLSPEVYANAGAIYRDMYKDVFGCRPSASSMDEFCAKTPDEMAAEFDRLSAWIDEQESDDLAEQVAALHAWRNRTAALAKSLGLPLFKVIRWDMAAHGCDHSGSAYAPMRWDVSHYCYKNGLATDGETTREVAKLARVPAPAPGY